MIKSGTLQFPDDTPWPVGSQAASQAYNSGAVQTGEGQLIERANQGDEAAWFTLVDSHQEPIFRLAYSC